MQHPKIYIYSGPVHSGKTTCLKRWIEQQENIDGILAPVLNNRRYLQCISSGEQRLLEAEPDQTVQFQVYQIGAYRFSKPVFGWARHLLEQARNLPLKWLVIDEIGFLELSGLGLEPMVSRILKNNAAPRTENIIIVVREKLLERVVEHYHLQGRFQPFLIEENPKE